MWSTLELQFLSVSLSVLVGLLPLFLGTIVLTVLQSEYLMIIVGLSLHLIFPKVTRGHQSGA